MNVYEYSVAQSGSSGLTNMSEFRGRVLLIVNTASECIFTPQLAGLEDLHTGYRDQGLTVLGFPCNQFGNQEPGSDPEIAEFCQINYGVTFPVMAKVEVNGPNADPLFAWLKSHAPAPSGSEPIEWNFTKFLVGRTGEDVRRFEPKVDPQGLGESIEGALVAVA